MQGKIKSIVLAAGASTRMKSKKSKLLHPLLGKSLIEMAFHQAKVLGTEKPLFVLGHQRQELIESLNGQFGMDTYQVAVQDPPQGTGDAIRVALENLKEESGDLHIFIMGGDAVLLSSESLKAFEKVYFERKAVLGFLTAHLDSPGAYGRVIRNSQGGVEKIIEAKNASASELSVQEINAGFYLTRLDFLRDFVGQLNRDSKSGEFYLTDLVRFALQKKFLVVGHALANWTESLGINTQEELALASLILRDRINRFWMNSGVSMQDPNSTWIDQDVMLGADVVIGPGVVLRGKCEIESCVDIGAYSVIESSRLGSGTRVREYCHLDGVELRGSCEVGPFARLRPGTCLEDGVKIGNFVEVKKSHFEKNSKANHLSYIGDAHIGEKANIGAGTITCNYDGFNKHQTEIGQEAFIGSNTSLVAPVKIGERAIVGAGSVITKNVQDGALAVERNKQEILVGAADKFRGKRKKGS